MRSTRQSTMQSNVRHRRSMLGARVGVLALLLATSVPAVLLLGSKSAQATTGTVTEFTKGITPASTGSDPQGITKGPDGSLWFTESEPDGVGAVGRITPSGALTSYSLGLDNSPNFITTGPDGNLWFTEYHHDKPGSIGRINPVTGNVKVYNLAAYPSSPQGITSGPDGDLWFADADSAIGQINPATGAITEYPDPSGSASSPDQIITGPDHNLWFTDAGTNAIVRFNTTTHAFTDFPLAANAQPEGIAVGPDGKLWFTEYASGQIGKITTSGTITLYSVPSGANSLPEGIVTGADANLWFTEAASNKVAKITTSGVVTEYSVPTAGVFPYGIALGPDGNVWFTEFFGGVGKVTPSGAITEYKVPGPALPYGITTGPDGNLWFAENNGNRIGRITPQGVITEFPVPTPNAGVLSLTAGSDGNVWFTEAQADKIGRITPQGVVTEFPVANAGYMPGITEGPDGNIWFTESGPNEIGRITPQGVVTQFPVTDPAANAGYFQDITTGSDGDLWFTEFNTNLLWRLDPQTGGISKFSLGAEPTPDDTGTDAITNGPDGNLWVTGYGEHVIWRVTTTGQVTTFPVNFDHPDSIDAGAGGNMWFTGDISGGGIDASAIGKLTLSGVETDFTTGIIPGGTDGGITTGPDGNQWFAGGNGADAIGKFEDDPAPLNISIDNTTQQWQATAGGPITYNFEVTNHGGATAPDVRVVDTLPPGAVFVDTVPASDNCTYSALNQGTATQTATGGTVSCDLGGITAYAQTDLTLVVDDYPTRPGSTVDTASVSSRGQQNSRFADTSRARVFVTCTTTGCPSPPPPPQVCGNDTCPTPASQASGSEASPTEPTDQGPAGFSVPWFHRSSRSFTRGSTTDRRQGRDY